MTIPDWEQTELERTDEVEQLPATLLQVIWHPIWWNSISEHYSVDVVPVIKKINDAALRQFTYCIYTARSL